VTHHRFFVSGPLVARAIGHLNEIQSRQVHTVLRLRAGAEIVVFDGTGAEATCELTEVLRGAATFRISDICWPQREPEVDLTVGLALLRGDRFELAVQKLTEIGVRRIVPLEADRCVVTFRDVRDWEKRAERLRRIIVEAMEQSERVLEVVLDHPVDPGVYFDRQPVVALRERDSSPHLSLLPVRDKIAIAVGPEGGWSERESALIERHATPASLGNLVLRAETAAIVAAGVLIQRSYST
jgi:16S rRNA (uracil1498-N3)-methyltransferase